jgi:hypothetical protein
MANHRGILVNSSTEAKVEKVDGPGGYIPSGSRSEKVRQRLYVHAAANSVDDTDCREHLHRVGFPRHLRRRSEYGWP